MKPKTDMSERKIGDNYLYVRSRHWADDLLSYLRYLIFLGMVTVFIIWLISVI
jgi:hypothetical protein